jgi:uncharacterized membrane protein HdeD (DUF308 family)
MCWEDCLSFKQILGLMALILGIAVIIFVIYGRKELDEGMLQVASGKRKVSQTQQLFSFTPVTQQVGKGLTSGAEQKIVAGELTIEQYENLFKWCQIGGIVLIVLGVGLLIFCPKQRRR